MAIASPFYFFTKFCTGIRPGLQAERCGYPEFGTSGLGGRVWLGGRPRELPAEGRVVGVALVESVVETKLSRVESRLPQGPSAPWGWILYGELSRAGQVKLGQTALFAQGARRTLRFFADKGTTRTSESRVVRAKLGPTGRGGLGSSGRPPALGRRQRSAEDRRSRYCLPAPPWGN